MLKQEEIIFKALDEELGKGGITLEVICVGGFVLSHYGMRTTRDVDGFFKATKKVNAIIKKIGDDFEINTDEENWLNNSVQNMNDWPPEEICDVLYDFPNLKVMMPPLDYVAGMKIESCREQDLHDVASIVKKLKITDPEELTKKLREYGFEGLDEAVILEAFGRAYGMEWLEKYYIENEEKICKGW